MRKLGAIGFVTLALVGACGSGGNKSDAVNDAVSNGAGALSKLAAGNVADVCGGRAAVSMGVAFASAINQAGETNYTDVANALRKAADAAPAEIKDDWRVIAAAEGPYFDYLAHADLSNYMAMAQDPAYLDAIKPLGSEAFQAASKNVNDWFAGHCK